MFKIFDTDLMHTYIIITAKMCFFSLLLLAIWSVLCCILWCEQSIGVKSQWVTGTRWAIAQLQPNLSFSKWSIISKQAYVWTHIVNSNVYVGLFCDDTPLWKCKAELKLGGRSHGTGCSLELFPLVYSCVGRHMKFLMSLKTCFV